MKIGFTFILTVCFLVILLFCIFWFLTLCSWLSLFFPLWLYLFIYKTYLFVITHRFVLDKGLWISEKMLTSFIILAYTNTYWITDQLSCWHLHACMLYCRYITAQRYSEALDILYSGACLQLAHGQVLHFLSWFLFFWDIL